MMLYRNLSLVLLLGLGLALTGCARYYGPSPGFFVTSVGIGDGGNLGGLAGADFHCKRLARNAGLPNRDWRAYLSTQDYSGGRGISARERIGDGPWYNVRGVLIARDLGRLHSYSNIFADTALDENGRRIPGVDAHLKGRAQNRHDILTGTPADGLAFWPKNPKADRTCNNWTSNSSGSAVVGHHDRVGGARSSWVHAHQTSGCSQRAFSAGGGEGLFYCFAAD